MKKGNNYSKIDYEKLSKEEDEWKEDDRYFSSSDDENDEDEEENEEKLPTIKELCDRFGWDANKLSQKCQRACTKTLYKEAQKRGMWKTRAVPDYESFAFTLSACSGWLSGRRNPRGFYKLVLEKVFKKEFAGAESTIDRKITLDPFSFRLLKEEAERKKKTPHNLLRELIKASCLGYLPPHIQKTVKGVKSPELAQKIIADYRRDA